MSLREEQCKKVCRILDDVLANRSTERDSLIVAVQLAFKSLSEPHWTPVAERLPEKDGRYYVTLENKYAEILYYAVEQTMRHPKGFYYLSEDGRMTWSQTQNPVIAWMPLPEPFKEVTT